MALIFIPAMVPTIPPKKIQTIKKCKVVIENNSIWAKIQSVLFISCNSKRYTNGIITGIFKNGMYIEILKNIFNGMIIV